MKQKILGTPFSKIAIVIRNIVDFSHTALRNRESLGTIVNDQIAAFLLTKLCYPHKVFIDIGAHIGSVMSAVVDHDTTIKIIAVEAMPDKAMKLRQKFSFVELHECAVGDSEGEVTFYINTKQSGYSSLGRPADQQESNFKKIKVPIRKLDNLVSSDCVDVIKIDVEGAELGVLRGSENLISKNRPVIMFESGPAQYDGLGFTKEDLWQWFADHDYVIIVPNRVAHNGPGLCQEGFIESHYYPRRTTNYFAVPIERRVEIRDRARKILKISAV